MESSYFIDPAGKVIEVAPEQAPAVAQVQGYVPASKQQIDDYALQQKYGNTGGQVRAALGSAADVLTFGGATIAQRALGRKPEDIAGEQAANPVSSAVGAGAGLLAGSLVPGLDEASAPALIGKAGKAATGFVEAATGAKAASGLARIGGFAAAHAAGFGAEGAAYAAGNVVHEAALGDPNLTAQNVMAEIGLGGLIGGGLGALVGAGSGALPKVLESAKDATNAAYGGFQSGMASAYRGMAGATGVASGTADVMVQNAVTFGALEKAAPGIIDAVKASTPEMADFMAKNATRIADGEASFPGLAQMLANGKSPEGAVFILDHFNQIFRDPTERGKVARGMYDAMSDVIDKTDGALKTAHQEILPIEREALLRGGPVSEGMMQALGSADPATVNAAYDATHDKIRTAIDKMRAEPELYAQARVRKLEQVADGLVRDASGDVVDSFERLRTLKGQLDEMIPYGQESAAMGYSERQAVNEVKALRGSVRDVLTDGAVFGDAAAREEALLQAKSEWAQQTQKGGDFRKLFMDKQNDGTYVLSPGKVDTHLNQITLLKGEKGIGAWDETVQAARNLNEQIAKSAQNAPGSTFDRAALDSLIEKSAKQTQGAREAATATRLLRSQDPNVRFGNGIAIPPLAQHLAEHVVPGVHQIVTTIKAATNVSVGVKALASLEHVNLMVSKKIDNAISTLVRQGVKADVVGRREAAAGIGHVFGMAAADRVSAMHRTQAKLDRLTGDPDSFASQIEQHTAPISGHAPQTHQALQIAAARCAQFLASKVPRDPGGRGPLASEWTPNAAAVAKFHRYEEAVNNPLSVIKKAAAGTLTQEHIEALQTCYPDLYSSMQSALIQRLTAPGARPPYSARLGMSRLMGQSMDGSNTGPAILHNQMALAPKPQQGPKGATPARADKVQFANRLQTPGMASASRK